MQTTKTLFSKTLLSMALIGLSGIAFANVDSAENLNNDSNASMSKGMKALLKEAGGLGYVDRNVYQRPLQEMMAIIVLGTKPYL